MSIVDNVVRALDGIAEAALEMQGWEKARRESLIKSYDNRDALNGALEAINRNLRHMADEVL